MLKGLKKRNQTELSFCFPFSEFWQFGQKQQKVPMSMSEAKPAAHARAQLAALLSTAPAEVGLSVDILREVLSAARRRDANPSNEKDDASSSSPSIDYSTWRPLVAPLKGHKHSVESVSLSPHDPDLLATGSYDSSIKLWSVASGTVLRTLEAREERISLTKSFLLKTYFFNPQFACININPTRFARLTLIWRTFYTTYIPIHPSRIHTGSHEFGFLRRFQPPRPLPPRLRQPRPVHQALGRGR